MSQRILLVAPASGEWRGIGSRSLFNGKVFRFSMLSLLTVARLSPPDARVRIVDEQVEEVPEDEPYDLVGITAMTAAAPRAYELARRFRARGIPVVLGGFHATLNPEEARRHVDAVVVGPATGAWPRVIQDLERRGRLEPVYRGDATARPPVHLPRHLIEGGHYVTANAVWATMGCRNACRFCSIQTFHHRRRTLRPVSDLVEEIGALGGRFVMFVDDNLTQDRAYALELLRALEPLGKIWVTQASVELADDPELLEAMARAGCIGVFVGLETFNDDALRSQRKTIRPAERYRDAVRRFHERGILVEAGIVFGFDPDDVSVFAATLRELERIEIDAVQVSILTPLPGTALHEDMRERIVDHDLEHYDYRHVVFRPRRMSASELQDGADWVIRSFYAPWRIARRVVRWMRIRGARRRLVYPVGLSLGYYGRTRRFGIRGTDPARSRRSRRRHEGRAPGLNPGW